MTQKALIVEDHRPLAEAISRLLSRLRVSAEVCGDGVEALKKYAAEPFDLLVIDLHLPRLNGVEVIRKIRATHRGRDLPIIISTGVYKGDQYAKKAQQAFGIKYYLEKPFSQDAFLSAVRDLLALPGAQTPAVVKPQPSPEAPAEKNMPVRMGSPTERAPSSPPAAKLENREPAPAPATPEKLAEIKPRLAVRGNLSRIDLDVLLLEARDKRTTGLLFVKKGDEERTVVFLNGLPVSIRTNKVESSLGSSLFNQGRVSLMEFSVYQGKFRSGPNPDEVLIKMGCLSPAEYFEVWTHHLEESLIQLFGWEDAEFTFQFWRPLPESSPRPQFNLAHVIHQGFLRWMRKNRLTELKKKAAGRVLALAPAYYDHQMHLTIDSAEALFLDRIDGVTPLEALVPAEAEEREKLMRSMGAFLSLGMIELRERPAESMPEAPFPIRERTTERPAPELPEEEEEPEAEEMASDSAVPDEPSVSFDDVLGDLEDTLDDVVEHIDKKEVAPARAAPSPEDDSQKRKEDELEEFVKGAQKKNFYEILEMKTGHFDFSKMKDTYFKLSKKFSPENFIMSAGDLLKKSEDALAILASAYNTLSNVVSKEKYDEMISSKAGAAGVPGAKDHDKMQAEVAFQSGMAFMEMDDWDSAEKSLNEAMSLAPNNADIIASYAYALYNKNKKSKTIQRRVQELLQQALKLKPRCASAFAYRGVLLMDDEKIALAEADFNKALSINPRYKFALKGMRMIEQKKQAEKKRLFGRFRK